MQQISILVYRFVNGKQKELYRNSFEWSTDIVVPFDSLYKSLQVLYPRSFVDFTIHPIYE